MRPALSVIIASYNSRGTIERTLASLAAQRDAPPFEVIVVDSSSDDTAERIARAFPTVRLLRERERVFAGHARNLGAAEASGDVLALLDADCIVGPEWAAAVMRAHEQPHPLIGGVVLNGNPESYVGWAYYFAEFGAWIPGAAPGFVSEVPGCSMTMKRAAYDRYGPFMTGAYCSDTFFVWRLAEDGHRPYLDPALRVAHLNPTRFRAVLAHEPRHGRDFARLRSRHQLTAASALVRAVTAPLLPPYLFLRAAARVFRHSRERARFVLAAPLTFIAMAAWSWGELSGYAEAAAAPYRERPAAW